MSLSFDILATVTASTKRPPAVSGGKRGAAAQNIASLSCTPLDPVDPELAHRLDLRTPLEALQTYVRGGQDIKEGDILVVGSTEYAIRACGDWYWRPSAKDFVALVVEELKTA